MADTLTSRLMGPLGVIVLEIARIDCKQISETGFHSQVSIDET
jgi:hypothetical protein